MTIHDQSKVAGVTEACKYNDHPLCNNPACACDCHAPKPVVSSNGNQPEPALEMACPKCGAKRPAFERYCRIDGSQLTSLACGMCGKGMNPEDAFCFNCGAPKGSTAPVTPKPVLTVPDLSNDEQSVLRALQEELGVQPTEGDKEVVDTKVLERPMGAQGSFTLVNKPNPNKIRRPVTGGVQQVSKSKLPIKPS